ncbi:MAG: hypothetical protein LBL35_07495 [Clostridiales bacterium]|jgi:hypothetical protein|nr:hypothetical protein [Clostridiales bacterium]
MIQISEVNIISIDKSEDSWAIEGEILFDGDLSTPFSVDYFPEYDEFENLEIEITPGSFDGSALKKMIINASYDYDE